MLFPSPVRVPTDAHFGIFLGIWQIAQENGVHFPIAELQQNVTVLRLQRVHRKRTDTF